MLTWALSVSIKSCSSSTTGDGDVTNGVAPRRQTAACDGRAGYLAHPGGNMAGVGAQAVWTERVLSAATLAELLAD